MIRRACGQDMPQIRRLWEYCFPTADGFNEYFFSHIFALQTVLLSEQDGVLCAMLQMLPYRLRTDGGTVDVTYIYGACTDPAYRRQGHMARLLEASFVIDREAGKAATALIPAERWLFDFYKPFGYEPFFTVGRREITRTAGGELPRRLTGADIPQVAALYDRLAPVCRIERDTAYWRMQFDLFDATGAGVYGWFVDGVLDGFAFCWSTGAQEAFGLTAAREQGLLAVLGLTGCTVTTCGDAFALGCIKWYDKRGQDFRGYMNLMLN